MCPCGWCKQLNYTSKELYVKLYILLQEEALRPEWKNTEKQGQLGLVKLNLCLA